MSCFVFAGFFFYRVSYFVFANKVLEVWHVPPVRRQTRGAQQGHGGQRGPAHRVRPQVKVGRAIPGAPVAPLFGIFFSVAAVTFGPLPQRARQ